MLQVTDDLIRNVVQEVLGHMQKGAAPAPAKSSGNTWGVFDSVDDAVAAATESQRRFEAMGLDARRKAVNCVRKICIEKAEMLGLEEFEETKIGKLKHKIEKLIVAGEKTPGVRSEERRVGKEC